MGLIYSQDFIIVADAAITARSTTSGYLKADIMDFWHLKARHRAGDLTKSNVNPLFRIDMAAAKTVVGVYLSDVNYDTVRIRGHATDLTTDWTSSSFDSDDVTLSQNPWTGRYQGYVPLTAFNYRWISVCTPAAADPVGAYQTYWETGVVAILDSVTELACSYRYPLVRSADHPIKDVGRSGRVILSDVLQWHGKMDFDIREATLSELQALNRAGLGTPMLLYFNGDDDSDAYLVLRENAWQADWWQYNSIRGAMSFKELVGM